jgi:hypothetical protein
MESNGCGARCQYSSPIQRSGHSAREWTDGSLVGDGSGAAEATLTKLSQKQNSPS